MFLLVLLGSVDNVLSTEYRRVGRLFLLVLLDSVDDIETKNKKELLDEIDTLTECLTL